MIRLRLWILEKAVEVMKYPSRYFIPAMLDVDMSDTDDVFLDSLDKGVSASRSTVKVGLCFIFSFFIFALKIF